VKRSESAFISNFLVIMGRWTDRATTTVRGNVETSIDSEQKADVHRSAAVGFPSHIRKLLLLIGHSGHTRDLSTRIQQQELQQVQPHWKDNLAGRRKTRKTPLHRRDGNADPTFYLEVFCRNHRCMALIVSIFASRSIPNGNP
jgi:hypothetical protein